MAVVLNRRELKLTDTTSDTTIPDNDIAKLMYYLYSMCVVLQLDATEYGIQRLKDYEKFHLLSKHEQQELIKLCCLLSPDKLEGKCIFHSEELCKDVKYSNRFFTVDSTETAFVATDTVFVGSVEVSVNEFMAYETAWINKYYIDPMNSIKRGRTSTMNSAMITTSIVTPFNTSRNTTRNNDNWAYTSTSGSLDCCVVQ